VPALRRPSTFLPMPVVSVQGVCKMKRTKADIEQRADAIRAATPDVLPRLFEMQNQICDLCEHPMQDLIVATLEHSVPVIVFARGPLPIAKAERQCTVPAIASRTA
jgi:hypothetical protein